MKILDVKEYANGRQWTKPKILSGEKSMIN